MSEFWQLLVSGVATGFVYALLALGFVIIYKATGVFNLAQGQLGVAGAYLVLSLGEAGAPFWVALLGGMAGAALIGVVVDRLVLRHMVGKPAFAILMITLGIGLVIQAVLTAIYGLDPRSIHDPWGARSVHLGGATLTQVSLATVGAGIVVVTAIWFFFARTPFGIAMRAVAQDEEAARSLGVGVRGVVAVAWMLAGAMATIAAVFAVGYPSSLSPTTGGVALQVLPAVILGGLDSIPGAVLGGIVVGLTEVFTSGYGPTYAPALGTDFQLVAPYIIVVLVLWFRPQGLLGTQEVLRV
jgi:branched-chain amino acid transport system permease protein